MRTVTADTKEKPSPGVVGANVRRLREALFPGLSRPAFAARAGVSNSTISNIELGYIQEPSVETTRRLAAALGVSDSELLTPHGVSPIDEAIEAFLASDYARSLPGGPVGKADLEYLRRFPVATWDVLPPTPVGIYHLVMARRTDPNLRDD